MADGHRLETSVLSGNMADSSEAQASKPRRRPDREAIDDQRRSKGLSSISAQGAETGAKVLIPG